MRPLPLLFAAVTALAVVPAAADELSTARDQPLTEVSHAVAVRVADGIATYTVQRVFANAGDQAEEARLEIDLPYGAAATGLRIRARDRWFEGELLEAEKAERLYQELTGKGAWEPKDPALLYWQWADKLRLRVFPVMPGGTSTVEYTLTVPTRYDRGHVFLSYPRLAEDAAPNLATPVFTIAPAWATATTAVRVDGARVAAGVPLVLARPTEPAWLAAIPHDADASYVASTLEIADDARTRPIVAEATLTLDVEHTYKGDVRVELYTPQGARVEVFSGDGGGDNDVRGAFPLMLPAGTTAAGTWRLVVSDHAALDAGTLTAWSLAFGKGKARLVVDAVDVPLYVPDAPENASDGGVATIELAPPPITELAARMGKVVASKHHAFTRVEIDVAPQLRPLPTRPQVVFAIDASRSLGEPGVAGQLALVHAYLSHVPDAEVEIVVYRRTAARLFGNFIPAGKVAARLKAAVDQGLLAPGNGSALDEGARVAAAALATRAGELRLVITTDNALRGRWTNDLGLAALAAVPERAVVHVVDTEDVDSALALARDDDHDLAPLALTHHGVGATLDGLGLGDKHLPATVLGLVRPVRIDHFAVVGVDLERGQYDETLPSALDEGAGLRLVVDAPTAPDAVELTGMIWGDRYTRKVTPSGPFSRATAGWVFSEDDHHDLSPAEMMTVAMFGRAVSPVTSYLATEPGVRPMLIGFESRGSGSGYGSGAPSVRMGSYGSARTPPDPMKLLSSAVAACVAKVRPPTGWSVALTMETTGREVVDVVPGAGAADPIGLCLVEAVWALDLPSAYSQPRDAFPLVFR